MASLYRYDDADNGSLIRLLLVGGESTHEGLQPLLERNFDVLYCNGFFDIVMDHWAKNWVDRPDTVPAVALIDLVFSGSFCDSFRYIKFLKKNFPYMRIGSLSLLPEERETQRAIDAGAECCFGRLQSYQSLHQEILRWLNWGNSAQPEKGEWR